MKKEHFDILRLIRSDNIGPRTFHKLREYFQTTEEIFQYIERKKTDHKKSIKLAAKEEIEKELDLVDQFGAKFIFYDQPQYPERLKHIDDHPPVIIAKGNINLLNENKLIAIVGARNASFNSIKFCRKIVKETLINNFITVSGMARGIDTEVHANSLGKTIAVLSGGIDVIYPPENENLYKSIAESGCLIAENKIGMQPTNYHFPQRNRIIAGLAMATIVVEATIKSGSLITAKFASQYGKEVFAVPGFPLDQKFSGNNYLIKNGAHLLDEPSEIFSELNIFQKSNNLEILEEKIKIEEPQTQEELSKISDHILDKLTSSPVDIDEIALQLNTPISIIQASVLELELEGKVKRIANNFIINSNLDEYSEKFIYV